jgi:hypothetical protein
MKRKLKIEELSVESFVASSGSARGRGTVAAHGKPPRQTVAEFTCLVDDCQPTFVYSCPYDVCPE